MLKAELGLYSGEDSSCISTMTSLAQALYLFQPLEEQIRLRELVPCSEGAHTERGTDRGVSPESTRVALAVFLPKQTGWQREVSHGKAECSETPHGPAAATESSISDPNGKSVFAALLWFKLKDCGKQLLWGGPSELE